MKLKVNERIDHEISDFEEERNIDGESNLIKETYVAKIISEITAAWNIILFLPNM